MRFAWTETTYRREVIHPTDYTGTFPLGWTPRKKVKTSTFKVFGVAHPWFDPGTTGSKFGALQTVLLVNCIKGVYIEMGNWNSRGKQLALHEKVHLIEKLFQFENVPTVCKLLVILIIEIMVTSHWWLLLFSNFQLSDKFFCDGEK